VILTLIILNPGKPLCDALCETLAGPSGAGMYRRHVGTEDGDTGRIAHGDISDNFAALLPIYDPVTETTSPGNAAAIAYLAGQAGMTVTQAQIEEMLSYATITTEMPETALARIGLQLLEGFDDV